MVKMSHAQWRRLKLREGKFSEERLGRYSYRVRGKYNQNVPNPKARL